MNLFQNGKQNRRGKCKPTTNLLQRGGMERKCGIYEMKQKHIFESITKVERKRELTKDLFQMQKQNEMGDVMI